MPRGPSLSRAMSSSVGRPSSGTGFLLAPITNLISGQCLAVSVASSTFQFARLFSPDSADKGIQTTDWTAVGRTPAAQMPN
jgi:hypothetical protein